LNQSYLLRLSSTCAFIIYPLWPWPRNIRPRPHSTWPRPQHCGFGHVHFWPH